MLLSVIIVNYNVKYFLEHCLISVLKAMEHIDGEILVVDNASTDESFHFFQNRFREVTFTWNTTNAGFAKANNQALKMARGKYILFLNPDTIVPGDCFEKCISFIQSQKDNCALGIKMIDGSGNFLKESKRAFPSPLTSLFKLSGMSKLFPHSKTFAKYHLGYLSEHQNHEVDVLAGAFMMIPEKIIRITGGFDEQFFMYGEDIDLSSRIQRAGFRNYYFAESSIIHFKGESTKKGSLNYVKLFYKAMSLFVKKHYGSRRAGLYRFFIQAAIFFGACVSLISRILMPGGSRRDHKATGRLVIAGTETEFLEAKKLLDHSGRKNTIFERISPGRSASPGLPDEVMKPISSNSIQEIIFCEGQLTFKEIISMMELIPKNIRIQLLAGGSHAIISGNGQDMAGKLIPKKPVLAED